jgi:hypothetical protein
MPDSYQGIASAMPSPPQNQWRLLALRLAIRLVQQRLKARPYRGTYGMPEGMP